MKLTHLVLVALAAAVTTSCALQPVKPEVPEAVPPAAKPAPARPAIPKAPPKESIKEVPKSEIPAEVEAGKPVPGSKFAKLKVGMTLKQVENLIGPPARQWQHPTSKVSIPFYFGPDRWVIEYSYKGEGVLTFNSGGEQVLTQIEVNRAE